jgi:glutamate racemase
VTDVEALLLRAVTESLGTAATLDDNFFELGGDSMAALEVAGMLAEGLGRDVPLDALFEADDLRGCAAVIAAS